MSDSNSAALLLAAVALQLTDPFLIWWMQTEQQQYYIMERRNAAHQRELGLRPLQPYVYRETRYILHPPYEQFVFDVEARGDTWCLAFLRFTVNQIIELANLMNLKEIEYRHRYKPSPATALAIVLLSSIGGVQIARGRKSLNALPE
ncbi:hypothetical protein FN846DRAFT_993752 [Sphaerosporella brunnea]|uniref:Uncharacterized protein n=1 Tax=Sphaerosporella brunnea TaxID=1250544 RepID=A0A5J5EN11_9PEZI|nr:hypothetical protein FN846DRAFT_993752 [Sphaerosporella brunnea]